MSSQSKKPVRSLDRSDLFDLDRFSTRRARSFTLWTSSTIPILRSTRNTPSWRRGHRMSAPSGRPLRCARGRAERGRVSFDDVTDALRLLERQFGHYGPPHRYRQVLANRAPGVCSGAMLDVARTRPMARANRSIER